MPKPKSLKPPKKPTKSKAKSSPKKVKKPTKPSKKNILSAHHSKRKQIPVKRNDGSSFKRQIILSYRRCQDFFLTLRQRRHQRRFKKDLKIQKDKDPQKKLPTKLTGRQKWRRRLNPLTWLKFIFSLRGLIFAFKVSLVGLILVLVSLTSIYLYYRQDVPKNISSLQECIAGKTTKYYDRTGKVLLWASKSDVDCRPVQLDEVSPYLIDALISVEDKDFYEHRGFQTSAIARALWNNLFNQDVSIQGGSTLTQQYIKNAILKDQSRNLSRKVKELIIAIELERTFEKDEILVAYLNTVSFGSIYSGVEAASTGYFGKPSTNLALDEAALLVAALPAPSVYWKNPEAHKARQQWVLGQMLADEKISKDQYLKALEIDTFAKVITSHKQYENIKAPHFILEAEKRLTEELCSLESDQLPTAEKCENIRLLGYEIITTLDISTQDLIEKTIADVIPTIADKGFDNAAAVAVDVETGRVLGLVGSRDFEYPKFGQTNTVTQQRDPGSTFKVFDYAALMEKSDSWGPGSVFYDYETTFDKRGWTPQNYSGRHAGPITMRKSLGNSLNIPAIKAMYIAGIDNVHNFAAEVGIRTKLPCSGGCGLASAFGGGSEVRLDELTNAYATFSRQGIYLPLTYIDHVKDSDGQIVKQWRQKPEEVVSRETSYLINHMLADKTVRYTSAFNLNPSSETTMALKTGTDDNFVNNHIVGYSKSVAFGGWIGNHDEAVLFETERHTTPPKALMIKTFMEAYHRTIPFEKKNHWGRPAGIREIRLNSLTGYQINAGNNFNDKNIEGLPRIATATHKDIFPSWYVPKISPQTNFADEVTIDIISGKIATVCTPKKAQLKTRGIVLNNELKKDDPYYDIWQEAIAVGMVESWNLTNFSIAADDVHSCDDKKPKIALNQKPASCHLSCRLTFDLTPGDAPLTQVLISHNNQILSDGTIDLTEKQKQLIYDYQPLSLDSPRKVRGHLSVELVDKKLYSHKIDVFLNIEGFPTAEAPTLEPPPATIELLTANLDAEQNFLEVTWQPASQNFSLRFGGDCRQENTLYLSDNQTKTSVNISNFPVGNCQVYLTNTQNQRSNILEFQITPST